MNAKIHHLVWTEPVLTMMEDFRVSVTWVLPSIMESAVRDASSIAKSSCYQFKIRELDVAIVCFYSIEPVALDTIDTNPDHSSSHF